jgi:hypothetical protein
MAFSAPSSSIFVAAQEALEDTISQGTTFKVRSTSKFWREFFTTSMGAIPADELSKDYKYTRTFTSGESGHIEPDVNQWGLFGGGNTNVGEWSRLNTLAGTTWPDPRKSINRRPQKWSVPITSHLGTLDFAFGEALIDQHPAYVGERMGEKMEGLINKIARYICQYFLAEDERQIGVVSNGRIEDSSGTSAATGPRFVFQPNDEAIGKFEINQSLDFLAPIIHVGSAGNGGASQYDVYNEGYIGYVVDVDPHANEVTVEFFSDTEGSFGTQNTTVEAIASAASAVGSAGHPDGTSIDIPDGAIVVPYGTRPDAATKSWGTFGVNDYYKDSGALLGDFAISDATIDVGLHPQFRSLVVAETGSPSLSRRRLRDYCNRFDLMHDEQGHSISIFQATQGVLDQYLDELDAAITQTVAVNNIRSIDEGYQDAEATFTHNGKVRRIIADRWCPKGQLYGHVTDGQNWRRIVPPNLPVVNRLSGSTSDGRMPDLIPVELVAAMSGLPDNYVPIFDTSGGINQFTGDKQMPFMIRMTQVPMHPAGLKVTGLAESKLAFS